MAIPRKSLGTFSRRAFARIVAGAAAALRSDGGEPTRPGPLTWASERTATRSVECTYRADAQIYLLGVPLLRREGVGGGSVAWREYNDGGALRLLEFAGFSTPERAAGLNRMGTIRELVRLARGGGGESIYFGVMTSSGEETPEEARKALHSTASEQAYTAIDGRISASQTETATAHFMAPAAIRGDHRAELMDLARRALAGEEKHTDAGPAGGLAQSFLQALAELLSTPNSAENRYIYSGRPYRLHLARTPDASATTHFCERRIISQTTRVVRVSGSVRREAGGKETDFRLWIAEGASPPLPLRIEYQAKSYLRLVFEAV